MSRHDGGEIEMELLQSLESLRILAQIGKIEITDFAPGTNITFNWSDVSGAANYTIQIDDQNTFSSPIVNQNVTASQFSTSTLPTLTMWWRARANNASGNAGTWSAARRFEVKN
jgi:hypothetical protein